VLLIADDTDVHRQILCDRLSLVPGRERASTLGRYPRFEVVAAKDGNDAIRKATRRVSVLAVDLMMPGRGGLDVIQQIRPQRSDLAILAFTAAAPASEAVAAIAAGADHFHQYGDERSGEFEGAVELAIDRRRLVRLLEQSELQTRTARESLAALGAGGLGLPGLRPPAAKEAVLPFEEAARRYLGAAAKLYEGDPTGLAKALGVSYFALRRLLRRYQIPIPTKSRGK